MGTYADNVKDSAQTQENLNPQQDVFPVLVVLAMTIITTLYVLRLIDVVSNVQELSQQEGVILDGRVI